MPAQTTKDAQSRQGKHSQNMLTRTGHAIQVLGSLALALSSFARGCGYARLSAGQDVVADTYYVCLKL